MNAPLDTFPGSFFGPTTLVALLEHRARHQAADLAFTFLVDGETEEASVTYGELDRQAKSIAARLQELGMSGQRALLLYPPGLEFIAAFFGCLYAGVVAVPAYPPRMNRSLFRIQAIVADCEAKVALTTESVLERMSASLDGDPELKALHWQPTDWIPRGAEEGWSEPKIDGSTLAFLQYTSGSTGTPKGVMLTHWNLLHNSALISHAFEHTRSGAGVFWLPSYHDMGLIGGILQPIYVARPNVLMSPMSFLQRPIRWLRAISRYRGSTSGGPNFAYDLCLKKITDEQLADLDLSSWLVAFNGAEPIRPQTLERFAEKFAPCGFRREAFYPCYGLAEGTLLVTGGMRAEEPKVGSFDAQALENDLVIPVADEDPNGRRLVGCGHNLPDQEVKIVRPDDLSECGAGEVGEIWVRGPSVAQGYWKRDEETAHTFGARLVNGEGPFLRTGDLGFLQGDELYITGRLKDLIIVHGRNHYPQDLEVTAERSHPALREDCSAAFTFERDEKQKLAIVAEIERRQQDQAVAAIAAIRTSVSREHDLPLDSITLIRAGSIPKTSSGKIQRHACRRAYLDGTVTTVASWPGDVSNQDLQAVARTAAPKPEEPKPARSSAPSTDGQPSDAPRATEQPPEASEAKASVANWQQTADIVLEEVRRVARERADDATIDSTLDDVGLDSLERIELQAALEGRFGGRLPDDVGPELNTVREIVDAVRRYLGEAAAPRKSVPLEEVPDATFRFEQFPEYLRLKAQMQALQQMGAENPYFAVHEGVARDTTTIDGEELISFAGYNYVGLSGDPRVTKAAQDAAERYGTSVSASRLVAGERPLHGELERAIADFLGAEDAITFVGGHATNESTIGHLVGPGDLILHDSLAHNSIMQGAILSGARRRAFPHNDWRALEKLLADLRGEHRRTLIAIEGVYSMDGDYPDLPRFIEVKRRHKALLLVDEAHSLGVMGATGRGVGEHFGVDPADVDLWMGTLSKSLGSCGGYIAGNAALVELLKYTTPGFVFSNGLSPTNAAAALASLNVLAQEPERVSRLRRRSDFFRDLARRNSLNIGDTRDSAVVPVILGNSVHALAVSQYLKDCGVNVLPILYPAVEERASRLRFFITSEHRNEQIEYAIERLTAELERLDPAYLQAQTANARR